MLTIETDFCQKLTFSDNRKIFSPSHSTSHLAFTSFKKLKTGCIKTQRARLVYVPLRKCQALKG